jgi:hypothetical protein
MNEHPSPEVEKELREAFNAPNANPAFVRDLRATLLERSTMKTQTRTFPRLAWALVLAILLIGLLVASPRVAEALKRLLGYVPGVGYMEQGHSLRMLTAPVRLEKDGLNLTIEKGAADPQRTVLLGHIEGYFTPDRNNERYCDTPARLVLPDGRTLGLKQSETSMNGSKDSPNGSYYLRYAFEAMPVGQLEATLEIPCLMNDASFRDWSLGIHFQVADEAQVMPVIELPTASAEDASPLTNPVTAPASPSGRTLEGFSIVLDSETPLEDGYILSGSYQWTDPRFAVFSVQINDPKITDANGRSANFETVEPLTSFDPALKKLPFAYQIHGKDYTWPLTITVNSVTVNLPDESLFQFDAGTNPQVGQRWDVNIDVPIAGHIVHVQTIELTAGRTPTQMGFTFTMTSDPEVMGASIHDPSPIGDNGSGGGGGGGGGGDNAEAAGPITYGWALEGYSPAGVKTFVVSNLAVMFKGTWQVTWQPTQ